MKEWLRNTLVAIGIGIVIFLVFGLIQYFSDNDWSSIFKSLRLLTFTLLFSLILSLLNRWGFNYVNRKIGWVRPQKTFIWGVLVSFVLSAFAIALLVVAIYGFAHSFQNIDRLLMSSEFRENILIGTLISVVITIIFYLFNFNTYKKQQQQKVQSLELENISGAHEALKSQIGPHFLFNSLNVLEGLIEEKPENAQVFLQQLTSVYRYILSHRDTNVVSLREELDFARKYMGLVQMRFEDTIELEESIDESLLDLLLPPLALQTLLENCIKHNRISRDQPLKISVVARLNKLSVTNSLNAKKTPRSTTGIGLNQLNNKYIQLTNKGIYKYSDENIFKVEIELLTQKQIKMEVHNRITNSDYELARQQVEEETGFYWNLASYIVVNSFLIFLWYRSGEGYFWPIWPLLGWGIGLTFHGLKTFSFFENSAWRERRIKRRMEKIQRDKNKIGM